MTGSSHDEVRSVIGAYILGAVPPEEAPSIRGHIASCDECAAEVERLSTSVDALAQSVDPVTPPAGFGRRVLERVSDDAERPTAVASSSRKPLLALAAVLLSIGLLAGVALEARQSAEVNRQAATALLAAAQGMELEGSGGVVAKVVPTVDGAVFVATGLEELTGDRTYQLWFIRDGAPVSAGTFEVSRDVAVLRTSRSARGVEGAAVTVEPRGGSEQPTTQPLLQTG